MLETPQYTYRQTDRQTDRQHKSVFFCCANKAETLYPKGAFCLWVFHGRDASFLCLSVKNKYMKGNQNR